MPSGEGRAIGATRSLGVMAKEVMDGYFAINPLVLKKFDSASLKELFRQLKKLQTLTHNAGIILSDQEKLRARNHKLQRLHQAITVIEHYARIKKIVLV